MFHIKYPKYLEGCFCLSCWFQVIENSKTTLNSNHISFSFIYVSVTFLVAHGVILQPQYCHGGCATKTHMALIKQQYLYFSEGLSPLHYLKIPPPHTHNM